MKGRRTREPIFEQAVRMTLQLARPLDEPDELEDFYELFDE